LPSAPPMPTAVPPFPTALPLPLFPVAPPLPVALPIRLTPFPLPPLESSLALLPSEPEVPHATGLEA